MSDPPRTCGSCSACCTVLGVPELRKGTRTACAHLCGDGCGIYATRPGSCRTFECQWLRGVLEFDGTVDLDLRPDRCGVIFDYQPPTALGESFISAGSADGMFKAWEVEPGAAGRGRANEVVRDLAEHFVVAIMTHDGDGDEGS